MCSSQTGDSGCFGRRTWRRLPSHDPCGAHFFWVDIARARDMGELRFPKFEYYLDESDPDVLVLRRQDGSFVAAFSAQGASREGIVEAAKEDYYALLLRRVPKKGRRASGEGEGPDTTGAEVRNESGLD